MMTTADLEHTIAALSARTLALKSLVAAVAAHTSIDRKQALAAYDVTAQAILDRYSGLPIGETVLGLVEQAFADLRQVL
jgi:hypothetical protein